MSKMPTIAMCLVAGTLLLADCGGRRSVGQGVMIRGVSAGHPYTLESPPQAHLEPVSLLGRFVFDDAQHVRFGWPNSAIGARFTGTSLQVALSDYQPRTVNGLPVSNVFDIYLDNHPAAPLYLRPGVTVYTVARALAPGEHTVWLSKRTEGMVGSSTFMGFIPEPGGRLLAAPQQRGRRIEFVGASNETGYGDLGAATAKNMCQFSPETQDADVAYPKLVAEQLGADLVNISYAGRGVYQNADTGNNPNETIPGLYERVDPLDGGRAFRADASIPQVMVLDLGGNDFFGDIPDKPGFVAAYTHFVQRLRRRAPDAELFCVMGPTMVGLERSTMREYVQAVVNAQRQHGDTHIQYFEFPLYRGSALGCDYHPDARLQQSMAGDLLAAIRMKTGW